MREKIKKLSLILVICLIPAIIGLLSPRKNEKVSAQTGESLVCKKIIPIGEAASETANLFSAVFEETQNMRKEIKSEIATANKILDNLGKDAKNCDLSVCQPVCTNISPPLDLKADFWIFTIRCPECFPVCGGRKKCQGVPCPDIQPETDSFKESYQKLSGFAENIEKLIGPALGQEKTMPVTEDIEVKGVTGVLECTVEECQESPPISPEAIACVGPCAIHGPTKIPLTEWIKRKLERARTEFRACSTPPSDWPKFSTKGLFMPKKSPVRCKDAIEYGYQIEWAESKCQSLCDISQSTFDETECIKCLCGHGENWLCCSGE